ncbi:MAG: lysine--tRNA ligase [Candidatus Omnitrophota bacterium]
MEIEEVKSLRIEKIQKMRERGLCPYGGKFVVSNSIAEILHDFTEGREEAIAGRIVANRAHGKVFFMDILDQSGRMQIFIKADNLPQQLFEFVHELDIGDIIGIKGTLFKTKTGQQSLRVMDLVLLSKSLMMLPEKWHGLKDVELRYRQRYVDLIANPDVKELFIKRSKIISYIRSFLDKRRFLEVETPMLQPLAGGARGRPFKSTHNAYDMDVYLRIAPELYLKRLLVGGLEKVYELNRNFRNEGISTRHNPEFTMLEVYEAYSDLDGMMKLTEELISSLVQEMTGSYKITYQGREIDFTPPWGRKSFADIVKEKFDIDPEDSADTLLGKVKSKKGGKISIDKLTRSAVMKIVEDLLEEDAVDNPVFITDYFTFLCPLAKANPERPGLSERFELFITGMEVGNAYSELNDPQEQRKRLMEDLEDDVETGNRVIDEDFLNALEYGMPPAGGLGIGVDRLIMILTNAPSIRDVILFPLLKPQQK